MTARSPRRTFSALLVLVAFSTVFLDYWEYSRSFHADPGIWASTLAGNTEAPAQYRIGVLKAAELMALHTPLAMRHALALFDLIALLIAAFVLRSLLTRSSAWQSASAPTRWFGAAGLLVLLEYSLVWLTWYQRPETLTVAALLALSLWLSTYRLPVAGTPGIALTMTCLVLLGVLLGFTRADAGVTFHLGIALICLTPLGRNFALPRWTQCAASFAAAGAAGASQLYIMRVLFPHATYGNTPRFQLLLNLIEPIRLVPFALFLAPAAWMTVQVVRRRIRPTAPQAGLLIGSAMFLGLWFLLGKVDEVRIFLPFAFALTPLTVEAAMRHIEAT